MKSVVSSFVCAATLSLLGLVPACGGSDDTEPETEQGGSASTQGGTKATDGGTKATEGGTKATEGGTKATGGTTSGPGGAGDGITGTIDGVVHAHTFNAVNIPQQTETVVIGATSAMYPLYDAWSLRFLPKLGKQSCTGDTGTEDVFITFGSQTNYNAAGTTAGEDGACTIDVTSIAPSFEGSFSATLITAAGAVEVTAGSFRVSH